MDFVKAKSWMVRELTTDFASYDDCGEVNATKLAEVCAEELCLFYTDDDEATIPEEVFELAFEVSRDFVSGL